MSMEATREEMDRRLDKHMNKQNAQLIELMEKIENQVSKNEVENHLIT